MDPERWVDDHGDMLYRYALSRVHDDAAAQDLVQETFLAALKGGQQFAGRSTERTWLTGILRHKLVDLVRKESRQQSVEDMEATLAVEDELFDTGGRWRSRPPEWETDPFEALKNKEFRAVLQHCVQALPAGGREAFVLRELEGFDTDFLCKELDVSATNLWVILHRARLRLRACLSANWFEQRKVSS